MESQNVYYIQDIVYFYRQRNGSESDNKSVSFYCTADYFAKINRSYKIIYKNFKEHDQIGFYRYMYAKNMSYILYKFIDSKLLTDAERIKILKNMYWFYKLSKDLNVPAAQEAQQMIINKILIKDFVEAINYCKIIANIRTFVPRTVREDMSRPDATSYQKIPQYNLK